MRVLRVFLLPFLLVLLFGCQKDDSPTIETAFTGPKVSLGNGEAWSFIETDEAGNPVAIGVQFNESALEGLPASGMHAHETILQLPNEASIAPFNHITLDWNEHGHPPMEIYDLPHFDVHFYFMSKAERATIGPNDTTQFNRPLPAENLPPNYLETPGGVPQMGAHIIDLLSPEIAGTGIFTHTFIYGKYDGKINFLEPMVTKAFLDSKVTVSKEIRHPAQWQKAGYYPKNYSISFDASSKVYSILLHDLLKF